MSKRNICFRLFCLPFLCCCFHVDGDHNQKNENDHFRCCFCVPSPSSSTSSAEATAATTTKSLKNVNKTKKLIKNNNKNEELKESKSRFANRERYMSRMRPSIHPPERSHSFTFAEHNRSENDFIIFSSKESTKRSFKIDCKIRLKKQKNKCYFNDKNEKYLNYNQNCYFHHWPTASARALALISAASKSASLPTLMSTTITAATGTTTNKPGRLYGPELTHQNSEPVPVSTSKGHKLLTSASVALGDDVWENAGTIASSDAFSERPVDVGWVGGWASDFDALLNDPVGVKAFQEFSRREFCQESLQFFLEVQEFKKLTDENQIRERAWHTFNTYISSSATDPVNVDSKAKKAAEFALKIEPISTRAFAIAEKQIYNLMKFDSYQRFLKSKFYNDCALSELKGKTITIEPKSGETESLTLSGKKNSINRASETSGNGTETSSSKGFGSLFKQASNDGTKKNRRSLLPFGRMLKSAGNKAASFSSMQDSQEPISRLRSKFAESISKMRSKSLDEHIHNQIKILPSQDSVSSRNSAETAQSTHSSLADKIRSLNQDDSLDLSENVFSPSPDSLLPRSKKLTSKTDESSTGSSANPSNQSSPAKSSFSHNCNRDDCHFVRIICPDRSQTVISPQSPIETLESLVSRLFHKHNWSYPAYDVFLTGTEKPLEPTTIVSSLGCAELRVERRALFQIIFPDGDMIGVTAKLHRTCSEVLGNLLSRYDYRRDHVLLKIAESDETIKPDASIATLDNQVIIIAYRDDLEEYGWQINKNNIPAALNSPNKSTTSSRGDDTKSDSFFGKLNDQSELSECSSNSSPYKIVKANSTISLTQQQQKLKQKLRTESLDSGDNPSSSSSSSVINYRPSLKSLTNHNHFQSHKEYQTNTFYDNNNVPSLISSSQIVPTSSTTNNNKNNKTTASIEQTSQVTSITGLPPPLPPKNVATINSVLVGQISNPPPRPPPLSSIGNMNKFATNSSASVTATAGDASYV